MNTYVFQDWHGLLYIVQSKEPKTNAYVDWLTNNPTVNQVGMAIDTNDLKEKLEDLEVEKFTYIKPK